MSSYLPFARAAVVLKLYPIILANKQPSIYVKSSIVIVFIRMHSHPALVTLKKSCLKNKQTT